ncbi:Uncharacterised protein [Mycobacteroides abscessus]|nr:Uncharacterised protein [Mycobacteroides abscessus]
MTVDMAGVVLKHMINPSTSSVLMPTPILRK